MPRRDRYQPEIKLYYVEKSWSAEIADEREDKFKDSHTKDLASTGPDLPSDAESDAMVCDDSASCKSSDEDGSPSAKGKAKGKNNGNPGSRKGVQGSMQRELAFEVHFSVC